MDLRPIQFANAVYNIINNKHLTQLYTNVSVNMNYTRIDKQNICQESFI